MNNTHTQGNKPLNTPWGIRIAGACRAEPEQQINWFYCLIVPGREEKLIHNDSINSVADLLAKSTIHTLSFLFFLARSLSRTLVPPHTKNVQYAQYTLNSNGLKSNRYACALCTVTFSRKCRSECRIAWTLASQRFELSSPTGTKSFKVTASNSRYVQSQLVCMFYATFAGSSNSSYNNTNIHSILCTRWISQEPSIRACVCMHFYI